MFYRHPRLKYPLRVKATRNHVAQIVLVRINFLLRGESDGNS